MAPMAVVLAVKMKSAWLDIVGGARVHGGARHHDGLAGVLAELPHVGGHLLASCGGAAAGVHAQHHGLDVVVVRGDVELRLQALGAARRAVVLDGPLDVDDGHRIAGEVVEVARAAGAQRAHGRCEHRRARHHADGRKREHAQNRHERDDPAAAFPRRRRVGGLLKRARNWRWTRRLRGGLLPHLLLPVAIVLGHAPSSVGRGTILPRNSKDRVGRKRLSRASPRARPAFSLPFRSRPAARARSGSGSEGPIRTRWRRRPCCAGPSWPCAARTPGWCRFA